MTEPEAIASEMGVKPPYEFEAHEVRITQGGKIQAWVRFALKFFEVCKDFHRFMIKTFFLLWRSGERGEGVGITYAPQGQV
jgi:hypothetical protein